MEVSIPYTTGELWWPPPQPEPGAAVPRLDAAGFIGSEAAKGTYIDARNRRIMEDNRRQIAEAERSQREFEAKGRRG
jgi:hypothetical protein